MADPLRNSELLSHGPAAGWIERLRHRRRHQVAIGLPALTAQSHITAIVRSERRRTLWPPSMLVATPNPPARRTRGPQSEGRALTARRGATEIEDGRAASSEDAHAAGSDQQSHDDEHHAPEHSTSHDRDDPGNDQYHRDQPQNELHRRSFTAGYVLRRFPLVVHGKPSADIRGGARGRTRQTARAEL